MIFLAGLVILIYELVARIGHSYFWPMIALACLLMIVGVGVNSGEP